MPSVADLLSDLQLRDAASVDTGNFAPVLLLDQDEQLARLVACWPNVPASKQADADTMTPEGLPESARLRWLWSLLEPDPVPTWIRTAGLPDAPHIRRLCWVAIDNRMVHPDGSVSQWVNQYLSRLVADRISRGGR